MKQKSSKEYNVWIRVAMSLFCEFIHSLELKSKREDRNLVQRSYYDALNRFKELFSKIDSFEMAVRRRLAV